MDVPAQYLSNRSIEANRLSEGFIPDGNLAKAAWREAEWAQFDRDMSGEMVFPQAATGFAALWTEDFLYVAFRCRYSILNVFEGVDPAEKRWGLWNRDVVEVFLNPQPERMNHYYELEVAPNNQWIDLEIDKKKTPFNNAAWNSGFRHATRVDARERTWTCEMQIPVASMGVKNISPGEEWRVNFFRADGHGDDSQRRFLSWSPISQGRSFHVPKHFGILRFRK